MDTTQSAYDRIAPRFAELTAAMPAPVCSAAQAFLNRVGEDSWLLDLGCGPGRDLAWFEAHGAQAAGADFSAGMLSQAGKKTGCPLLQMDLRALGIRSGSIRGIWCNAALLHLSKKEVVLALQEIHRVLAPGGLLDLSVQEGTGEGFETFPDTGVQRFFARYSLKEMSSILIQAGYRIIQVKAVPDSQRSRVRWLWFLGETEGGEG